MSKNENVNHVARDTLVNVVTDAGLTVKEQSSYLKCTLAGSPAAIYIANTQKVSRVDFSRFSVDHDGATVISAETAKELKMGRVRGQLDFTQSEETVLLALTAACNVVKSLKVEETAEETTEETSEAEVAA